MHAAARRAEPAFAEQDAALAAASAPAPSAAQTPAAASPPAPRAPASAPPPSVRAEREPYAACLAAVAEGLQGGLLPSELSVATRALQALELAYWHALSGAAAVLPEPRMRGTEGRCLLPNGASLSYTDAGPRDGPVLLLLHGWPDSLQSWRVLCTLLHPRLRVIALSLRGFGDSTLPAAPAPRPDGGGTGGRRGGGGSGGGGSGTGEGAGSGGGGAADAAGGGVGDFFRRAGGRVRARCGSAACAPHARTKACSIRPQRLTRRRAPLCSHPAQRRDSDAAASALGMALPITVPALASDVRQFLARLGVERLSVAGYSLGALVARALAAGVTEAGAEADAEAADGRAGGAGGARPSLDIEHLFLMSSAPTGAKNHVAQKLLCARGRAATRSGAPAAPASDRRAPPRRRSASPSAPLDSAAPTRDPQPALPRLDARDRRSIRAGAAPPLPLLPLLRHCR